MMALRIRTALGVATIAAGIATTPAARAQEAAADTAGPAAAPAGGGFGVRDSFALSVERIFGFQQQELGPDGAETEIDTVGLHPVLWGHLGLFKSLPGGLNYGAVLGVSHFRNLDDDETEPDGRTAFRVGPRIGYAQPLQDSLGYWVRGGPSMLYLWQEGDTTDSVALGASLEAYAVITPWEHVHVLFGPHLDLHIWGKGEEEPVSGEDSFEYRSVGLTAGLMGEFW
jgi:hypothetical protein